MGNMTWSSKPLDTKGSGNRNVHIVTYDSRGNLVLAPGPAMRNSALGCLATLPIWLYLCHHFRLDTGLWISAALFPVFAAGGTFVAHVLYAKYGTRCILDSSLRIILISGIRHTNRSQIPFDEVVAVQRIHAGARNGGKHGHWASHQLNLVLSDNSRYNLLDSSGKKQLDKIGEELANYLRVPFVIDDQGLKHNLRSEGTAEKVT